MGEPETLNQMLARAAGRSDCGLRILDRREDESWHGWSEISGRAQRVAGGLRALGVERGEAVGLFFPTGPEFFWAFFGVLNAGAVPVPLYPPVRLGRLAEYQVHTGRMLAAAGVRWALSDAAVRRILGEALARAGARARTLADLPNSAPLAEPVTADDLALVQFSSGTTAEPKPVALTHRAIVSQVRALNQLWPDDSSVRHTGVSWLPLYHDMGLIGCVFPALERPSVLTLIPPEVFVTRPAIWLRVISRYRATISPAPNFGYGLCVEKISDQELEGVDLSCWQIALNGAEAVIPAVLRAFNERFTRWGLRARAMTPVYGLAEAALAVTFSDIGTPFVSRRFSRHELGAGGVAVSDSAGVELVALGRPLNGFEIEVRDPAGKALPVERVGRIWARGPSLMREYLGQPEATERALRDGWLDTGDLGFVSEGQLFVTGRAKDILIVRGCNHGPDEIESVADELPMVRTGCSAAVSHLRAGAEREEIWLFVERTRESRAGDVDELVEACQRRVLARTGMALDRVEVLEPGTLPRTSSGKIRRQETLGRFLTGTLQPPERPSSRLLLKAMGRSLVARLGVRLESTDGRDSG